MKETKKCKECGKRLPRGNSIVSYAARTLGYCRYCYLGNYPPARRSTHFSYRQGMIKTLNWTEIRLMERAGFNPDVWSPEFRHEMYEYWRALLKGEI